MEVRVALGELVTDQKFGTSVSDRVEAAVKAAQATGGIPSVLLIENSGGILTFPASLIVEAQAAFDAILNPPEPAANTIIDNSTK